MCQRSSETLGLSVSPSARFHHSDGDLDTVTSDFRTKLFLIQENQGDGTWLRLPNQLFALEAAFSAIGHDRDNDGDLDITGIDEVVDQLLLFRH